MSPLERLQATSSKWDWRAGVPARGGGGAAGAGRMRLGARASSLSPMRGASLTTSASRATHASPAPNNNNTTSTANASAMPSAASTSAYDPLHRFSSPSRRKDQENYSKERNPRGRIPRRSKNPSDHGFRSRRSTQSTGCSVSRRNSQTDRQSVSYAGWLPGVHDRAKKDSYTTRRNASPGVARALDWRPEVPWVESRLLSKGQSMMRRIPGTNERSRSKSMLYYQQRFRKHRSTDSSHTSPLFQPRAELDNVFSKEDNQPKMKRHGSECILTSTYNPLAFLDDLKFLQKKKSKQVFLNEKRNPNKSSSEMHLPASRGNAPNKCGLDDLIKNRKDKPVKHLIPRLEMFHKREKRPRKSAEKSRQKDSPKNGTRKPKKCREQCSSTANYKKNIIQDLKILKKGLPGTFEEVCNLVMYHTPTESMFFSPASSMALEDLRTNMSATSEDCISEDFLDENTFQDRDYGRKQLAIRERIDNMDTEPSRFKAITPAIQMNSDVFSKGKPSSSLVSCSGQETPKDMQKETIRRYNQTVSDVHMRSCDESKLDHTNLSSHSIFSDTILSCDDVFESTTDKILSDSGSKSIDLEVSINETCSQNLANANITPNDSSIASIHIISVENIETEVEEVKISLRLEETVQSVNTNSPVHQELTAMPESPICFEKQLKSMESIKEEEGELPKSKDSHSTLPPEKINHQPDKLCSPPEQLISEKEARKQNCTQNMELTCQISNESGESIYELNVACRQELNRNASTDEVRNVSRGSLSIKTELNSPENIVYETRDKLVLPETPDQVDTRDTDRNETIDIYDKSSTSSHDDIISTNVSLEIISRDSDLSTWTNASSHSGETSECRLKRSKTKKKDPVSDIETAVGRLADQEIAYEQKPPRSKSSVSSDKKSDAKRLNSAVSTNSKSGKPAVDKTPQINQSKERVEPPQDIVTCTTTIRDMDEISVKQRLKSSRESENKREGSCVICDIYLNAVCDGNKLKESKEMWDVEIQNPSRSEATSDHQRTQTNLPMNTIQTDALKDVTPGDNIELKRKNRYKKSNKTRPTSHNCAQVSKHLCSSNTTPNLDTSFGVDKHGHIIPANATLNGYKERRPARWYTFDNNKKAKHEQKFQDYESSALSNAPRRKVKPIITSPDHSISEKQTKNRIGARVFHTKPKAISKTRLQLISANKRIALEECRQKLYANSVKNLRNERSKYPSILHLERNFYRVPACIKCGRSLSKFKFPSYLARTASRSTSTVHTQTDWVIPPVRVPAETRMLPNKDHHPAGSKDTGHVSKSNFPPLKPSCGNETIQHRYTEWLDRISKRLKKASPNLQSMFKCENEEPNTLYLCAPESSMREVKNTSDNGIQGVVLKSRSVYSHPTVPLRSTRSMQNRNSREHSTYEGEDHSQHTSRKVRCLGVTEKARFKYIPPTSSQSIKEDVSRSQILSDTFRKQLPSKDGESVLRLGKAYPSRLLPSKISLNPVPENFESTEDKPSEYVPKLEEECTKQESSGKSFSTTCAETDFGGDSERKNRRYKIGSLHKYSSSLGSHLQHIFRASTVANKPLKSIVCVPRGDKEVSDRLRKSPLYTKKSIDLAPKPKSDFFKAIKFPIWHL